MDGQFGQALSQDLSLYLDDLDPVRAFAHRITRWVAELSTRLVDPVNRKPIRFLTGGNKILSARINIDATRLSFGGKIGHICELARIRGHCEQRDLVGVTLGRIKEFSV